jgi:hypothetical protein
MADEWSGDAPPLPQLLREFSSAAKGDRPLLSVEEKDAIKEALQDDGADFGIRRMFVQQLAALRAEAAAVDASNTEVCDTIYARQALFLSGCAFAVTMFVSSVA